MVQQFEFCRVCRQNHNQGRGHRYSTKHRQCLERSQGKMLERVQEIRHFVENVLPVTNLVAQDRHKFWCHFCEQDIIEKDSSFASAEAIKHLASSNHVENIKSFWAKNGGDVEKQSMYIIEGTELAKWEERCAVALRDSVRMDAQPLSSSVNETIIQSKESVSSMPPRSRVGPQRPILGLSDARVPSFEEVGEGNVHSGAAPPWLKQKNVKEGDALIIGGTASSSRDHLVLSRTQHAKLLKMRNPNRVGAAWAERRRAELVRAQGGEILLSSEGEGNSSWLPNFGRVWQSGPRRDTRKEFETEKKHSKSRNQRRVESGLAKKNVTSSRNFEFKPYVSRRQTKEGV